MNDFFGSKRGAIKTRNKGLLSRLTGAYSAEKKLDEAEALINGLTVHELRQMIRANADIYIIDVRTPSEYTWGHIAGSMSTTLDDIEATKRLPYAGRVVLVCEDGAESVRAKRILRENNAEAELFYMIGGMVEWKRAGYVTISD